MVIVEFHLTCIDYIQYIHINTHTQSHTRAHTHDNERHVYEIL